MLPTRCCQPHVFLNLLSSVASKVSLYIPNSEGTTVGLFPSHLWGYSDLPVHPRSHPPPRILGAIYVMRQQDGLLPCELHEWASLHAQGELMRNTDSKRVSFVELERRSIDELRVAKASANQRPSRT